MLLKTQQNPKKPNKTQKTERFLLVKREIQNASKYAVLIVRNV
jgi:hypothetical protein